MSRVELIKDLMIFLNYSVKVLIVDETFIIIETFVITESLDVEISNIVENVERFLRNFVYEKDFA